MKVAFYPVGDINRASSRYRVYWIVEACPEFMIGNQTNWRDADVVVFQRAFTKNHQNVAVAARKAGKLVVLDISDFHFHRAKWKKMWPSVKAMASYAHVFTTSNVDDAHEIRETIAKGRPVYIIPNAQKMSSKKKQHSKVAIPTIGWLGRENTMLKTLGTIWPALSLLSAEGIRFRFLIVNDTGSTHGLVLPGNEVVGKKWKLSEVNDVVMKFDLGVCPQLRQPDGRYHKDENKAVTLWSAGVPCVSFARTKDWYGDLRKLLTDWRFRQKQGAKGIERAKEWQPASVVKQWKKMFAAELKKS